MCLYELSLRFRSNDIWCHLFEAFSNNNNANNEAKKTELLAEHFAFVFIELTLFEVIHMNLLVMRTHSPSLLCTQLRLFQEFAFAFYWIESKKRTSCISMHPFVHTAWEKHMKLCMKAQSPCLQLCTHFRKFYFTHSYGWKCISICIHALACECKFFLLPQ